MKKIKLNDYLIFIRDMNKFTYNDFFLENLVNDSIKFYFKPQFVEIENETINLRYQLLCKLRQKI